MLSSVNQHFIFIAHNAKSFDSYPIIREFQKRLIPTDAEMSVTTGGNKLLGIKFRDVYIKDSSLFIQSNYIRGVPRSSEFKGIEKRFLASLVQQAGKLRSRSPPRPSTTTSLNSCQSKNRPSLKNGTPKSKIRTFALEMSL
jgi:hypothetical protein